MESSYGVGGLVSAACDGFFTRLINTSPSSIPSATLLLCCSAVVVDLWVIWDVYAWQQPQPVAMVADLEKASLVLSRSVVIVALLCSRRVTVTVPHCALLLQG